MILDTAPLPGAQRQPPESEGAARASSFRRATGSTPAAANSRYDRISAAIADKQSKDPAAETMTIPTKSISLWEKSDFGFGDFLDIINPLQHIPIVATLYRNMTGDQIGLVPRVIGGALWGRIGGFVAGLINAAVEWFTGKDIGDHIYAAIRGGARDSTNDSAIARAVTPPASASEESSGASPSTNGQHSSPTIPALEEPSDSKSSSDVTVIKPLSSSSTAVPPAYLLAAQAAISHADAGRNSCEAARRQLRFTA